MGPQYKTIRNDCFLLTLAGKNLLFTGDADHVVEYFERALAEVALDVVFVNPIFYHNPTGQEIINDIFRPRDVVIYHMPFEQDDTMQFSYMVNSDIQKHGHPEIQTHVLCGEKQSFCLSAPASK
jgi:L-ascorbate metabolism protein UlaG (beta-lactamase superfamily)